MRDLQAREGVLIQKRCKNCTLATSEKIEMSLLRIPMTR